MYFRHNQDDTIEINGETFSYTTFLQVNPGYIKPKNLNHMHYEVGSYFHVVFNDGLAIDKPIPWEEGDFYIRSIDKCREYEKKKNQIQEKVKQTKNIRNKTERISLPSEKMLLALWDHLVEREPKEFTVDRVKNEVNEYKQRKNYED